MNLDDVRALIRKGESDRVEFKSSTGQKTAAAKTVCAMLNGLGGFVIFGVTDKGEIIGQHLSTKTLEEFANEFRRIEPPAFPDIETIPLKGDKAVIVVYVPGGSGPYIFDGRPYMRNGPTTIRMPREEYERRLLERLHATQRWENQPVPDEVTINDLDAEEIQTTLGNAIQLGRLESTIRRDTESILRGLELIHEGRLLNADDYLEITNPGTFHFGITPEKLTRPHESKPWNPIIANVFYRAGIVERWGSGTLNILDWCRENGNPPPASNRGPWSQVCPKSVPNDIFIALLETANNPVSIEALMKVAEQTNRTRFRKTILRSLLDAGLIEMTIPDKPRSSKQRYWLTEKGRHFLKEIRGGDDADE